MRIEPTNINFSNIDEFCGVIKSSILVNISFLKPSSTIKFDNVDIHLIVTANHQQFTPMLASQAPTATKSESVRYALTIANQLSKQIHIIIQLFSLENSDYSIIIAFGLA